MKYNKEAKSLTFRRGSEVSHENVPNLLILASAGAHTTLA